MFYSSHYPLAFVEFRRSDHKLDLNKTQIPFFSRVKLNFPNHSIKYISSSGTVFDFRDDTMIIQ